MDDILGSSGFAVSHNREILNVTQDAGLQTVTQDAGLPFFQASRLSYKGRPASCVTKAKKCCAIVGIYY